MSVTFWIAAVPLVLHATSVVFLWVFGHEHCLPEHVRTSTHADWLRPFRWVPRRWTSRCWREPIRLLGNQTGPFRPIPRPGQWYATSPFCVAFTTRRDARSFRYGVRFDYVDRYYTLFAAKFWRLSVHDLVVQDLRDREAQEGRR